MNSQLKSLLLTASLIAMAGITAAPSLAQDQKPVPEQEAPKSETETTDRPQDGDAPKETDVAEVKTDEGDDPQVEDQAQDDVESTVEDVAEASGTNTDDVQNTDEIDEASETVRNAAATAETESEKAKLAAENAVEMAEDAAAAAKDSTIAEKAAADAATAVANDLATPLEPVSESIAKATDAPANLVSEKTGSDTLAPAAEVTPASAVNNGANGKLTAPTIDAFEPAETAEEPVIVNDHTGVHAVTTSPAATEMADGDDKTEAAMVEDMTQSDDDNAEQPAPQDGDDVADATADELRDAGEPEDAMVADAASEKETPTAPVSDDDTETGADNIADSLNAKQDIKQTMTVTKTVNGEVVETQTVEVPNDPKFAKMPTEAGVTKTQAVLSQAEREILTRTEAAEEAKVDFTLADKDNDGKMTLAEYEGLFVARTIDPNYKPVLAEFKTEDGKDSPLITGDHAQVLSDRYHLMSGVDGSVNQSVFLKTFMNDFDLSDRDQSATLTGDELVTFRSLQLARKVVPTDVGGVAKIETPRSTGAVEAVPASAEMPTNDGNAETIEDKDETHPPSTDESGKQ